MKCRFSIAVFLAFMFLHTSEVYANADTDEKNRKNIVEQINSALSYMSIYDVGGFLIEAIPRIQGGISCPELSGMLGQASVYDRGGVVQKAAPYVHRPFSKGCFRTLSRLVSIYDAADAISALQRSVAKYNVRKQ